MTERSIIMGIFLWGEVLQWCSTMWSQCVPFWEFKVSTSQCDHNVFTFNSQKGMIIKSQKGGGRRQRFNCAGTNPIRSLPWHWSPLLSLSKHQIQLSLSTSPTEVPHHCMGLLHTTYFITKKKNVKKFIFFLGKIGYGEIGLWDGGNALPPLIWHFLWKLNGEELCNWLEQNRHC